MQLTDTARRKWRLARSGCAINAGKNYTCRCLPPPPIVIAPRPELPATGWYIPKAETAKTLARWTELRRIETATTRGTVRDEFPKLKTGVPVHTGPPDQSGQCPAVRCVPF